MSSMQKVIDPLAALVVSFGLSHFIVVMRELQIDATTVNIQVFSNNVRRHYRAFNVPSRTPRPPRRFPRWFSWLAGLPQSKVVALLFLISNGTNLSFRFGHFFGCSFITRIEFAIIKPVFFKSACIEIDGSTGSSIGIPIVDNALNEFDNLRNILCDASHHIKVFDAQGSHVLKELPFPSTGVSLKDLLIRDRAALFFIDFGGQGIMTGGNPFLNVGTVAVFQRLNGRFQVFGKGIQLELRFLECFLPLFGILR
mmetsp:Transcript_12013/g.26583  ORF Transcript_12013/g.26583 Transcript_12013/m.26583 type:complete len:254 (+) Transcript_12013:1214-1975(+)